MKTYNIRPLFFIFGFGYTAEFLADKLALLGFQVIGTTRNQQKLAHQTSATYKLIDFADPQIGMYLNRATHILVCIPPNESVIDYVVAKYSKLIKHSSAHIQWLGYLSSTGVYGDHQGKWVNEVSPCIPATKQGKLRLQAEQAWLKLAEDYQFPLQIFRLAGIYGPRRNTLERIQAGKSYSIYKADQFFSRIHVADIISVITASIEAPKPLAIYNVADNEPSPSHVVDAYAATLLNKPQLPLIPFEKATLSSMEQVFYSSNRRISNNKIKNELHITLQYPTYREGLAQIMEYFRIK